jgi:hypothetical protein
MQVYSQDLQGQEPELLDHIISFLSDEWVAKETRVTVQKILKNELFGISKYLIGDVPIHSETVRGSADRERLNTQVQHWIDKCGIGKNICRLGSGIVEEMLMNAIYDAPVAGGRSFYEDLPRTEARQLAEDEYATLSYGADGDILAISIADPFGAFKREKFFSYLQKVLRRHDSDALIDKKKGGAGLGLFKMLYSSHAIICNVEPGKRTEVIALIDLAHSVRDFSQMPRSIHFFSTGK